MSAAQARKDAGFSLQEAARRARVCATYLRRIELHGDAPYVLAMRLANLYGCSTNLFLYAPTAPKTKKIKGPSRRPKSLSDGRKPPSARRESLEKNWSNNHEEPDTLPNQ
jgi:hypothetical protein